MFRHHLLLFVRNFKRHRSTFIINLVGLSSGLCCVLMIYLWVNDELAVDKFHMLENRLVQVMENQEQGGEIDTSPGTPDLLAQSMEEDFPEVEQALTVYPAEWFDQFSLSKNNTDGKQSFDALGQFATDNFFKVFSYPLVYGEQDNVLKDKSSIAISIQLAERLFGSSSAAMGQTLEWNLLQYHQLVTVSGVFDNMSAKSSLKFDFVLNEKAFDDIRPWNLNWGNTGPNTYLSLTEGTDIKTFDGKITDYIKTKDPSITYRTLFARPFSEAYLYGNYENGQQSGGRIEYVRLFSIIAFFILLIACINFMNLSTAKASRRVKEVGIKKAVGANRSTLIFQYLSESVFLAILSLLIGIILVNLLLPQFNLITGKDLDFNLSLPLVLSLVGVSLFTGLVAGSYPAIYLSAFKPATVLKGKLNRSVGEAWARKGLVVFQFTLSVILIVSVLVVYQQIRFVQDKNLGFEKDNLITLPIKGNVASNLNTFVSELRRIPGVQNASFMKQNVIGNQSSTVGVNWPGKDQERIVQFQNFSVGYEMIETLGLHVLEGRSFREASVADSSAIIFNESAIKIMGLEDPVGTTVNLWGEDREIIGVVQDFHYQSLREKVRPAFFKIDADNMMTVIARLEAGNVQSTIAQAQDFYQKFNPEYTFEYRFIDNDYQSLYQAEQKVSSLSKYFAALAILISCLGLFGLAAFTAERRIKEIGIRKVLGSSNLGIVMTLSSDFSKMVITAILIALPLSYLAAESWLEGFAYKIELQWWYFIGAGFLALLIAWATVGIQSIKASLINPIQCLRDE